MFKWLNLKVFVASALVGMGFLFLVCTASCAPVLPPVVINEVGCKEVGLILVVPNEEGNAQFGQLPFGCRCVLEVDGRDVIDASPVDPVKCEKGM